MPLACLNVKATAGIAMKITAGRLKLAAEGGRIVFSDPKLKREFLALMDGAFALGHTLQTKANPPPTMIQVAPSTPPRERP